MDKQQFLNLLNNARTNEMNPFLYGNALNGCAYVRDDDYDHPENTATHCVAGKILIAAGIPEETLLAHEAEPVSWIVRTQSSALFTTNQINVLRSAQLVADGGADHLQAIDQALAETACLESDNA